MIGACRKVSVYPFNDLVHSTTDKQSMDQSVVCIRYFILGETQSSPAVHVVGKASVVCQRFERELMRLVRIAFQYHSLFGREQGSRTEQFARHGTVLRRHQIGMRP